MTIQFKCKCGTSFEVKEDQAGKQTKCPVCGDQLSISMNTESPEKQFSSEKSRICPICKCPMKSDQLRTECPDCRTEYHSDCWQENGGCGVYGCKQVPLTEHRNSLEIPAAYWGQENKPCPVCGAVILATAVRCRHCGATFSSARPENADEHRQRKSLEERSPQIRRKIIWLFILSVIPFTAPLASIWGGFWCFSNHKDIKTLPTIYSAISYIALCAGIGQTIFIALMVMMFNAWQS